MSDVTQCPECSTRFKVSDTQLDAHDGLVRCGRCHEVFNARDHLHSGEPNPQMDFLNDLEPINTTAQSSPISHRAEKTATTLAEQVQFVEELTEEIPNAVPPASSRPWLSILMILLLTLALIAQTLYFYRVEIAARLPGLKPLLVEYCSLLDCTVALPHEVDLITIESSELESDPKQSNIVTLHVLIHNSAPFAQAYPNVELTLTDTQDHALARRTYQPKDYLKPSDNALLGTPSNRDLNINLHLDTTDLKPSGYRLFLFYPK